MILLYGISEDSPISLLRAELDLAKADYRFLNHRDIFRSTIEYTYSQAGPPGIFIHSNNLAIDFSEVTAVYARPYNFMDYPERNGAAEDDPFVLAAIGFENQFMACIDASDALIVNKSEPSASNNSKPYQLSVIKEAGLKIPFTFITNEPVKANQFIKENVDCIYKSISGIRSIVRQVSHSHLEHLEDVSWCPTLFQKVVPGINYRAHVIGDDVYTVRIDSDSLDYRYGKNTMMIDQLPADISQKCVSVTSALGLHFSGIDLMRTSDDEWYCFEVNPSPAYSYFQLHSGLQISKALAKMLINGA